jgi:hypothetical protein
MCFIIPYIKNSIMRTLRHFHKHLASTDKKIIQTDSIVHNVAETPLVKNVAETPSTFHPKQRLI